MMKEFKVGDRVKVVARCDGRDLIGKTGKVVVVDNTDYNLPIGVQFDERIDVGHNCDNNGVWGYCWWCESSSLELESKYADRIIFRDYATILIKDGKRYVTKCEAGDTYDREKGLLVALAKANGYNFNDIQEMLKNAEIQGEDKQVREVKRHAKVGEYIKIINAINTFGHYTNGDIFKVIGYHLDNAVLVNKKRCVQIFPKEYVVLENYKPNK